MKKHLLLIAGAFFVISAQAQTNTVLVTPDTEVKVKPNTLFYVDGDMKLEPYTLTYKSFSNEGKVEITDKLEVSGTALSFRNEHKATGEYGQLIVKGSQPKNIGKISSIIKNPSADDFVFMPLAIPYRDITALDVVNLFFGSSNASNGFVGYNGNPSVNNGFDRNRVKNALFTWNNDDFRFDHLSSSYSIGQAGHQADYYALNAKYSGAGLISTALKYFRGVPVNEDVTVALKKYTMNLPNHTNTSTNQWGEAYGSYIIDFTKTKPSGWSKYQKGNPSIQADFGSRIYNLGNPYTSNINLINLMNSNSMFKQYVEAIVQYRSQDYDIEINKGNESGSKGVSASYSALTRNGAGDANIAIVAPFQTFAVKLDENMPSTVNVNFTDAVKTFDGPTGSNPLINTMFRKSNIDDKINQVGIDLYDSEGYKTSSRAYIVASKTYGFDESSKNEIYNVAMNDKHTGIYTLQENEDGTVRSEARTYINGINSDKYIAKPIHLVFQNGAGKYTIKARLNENLEKNKNAFYFEDKETGKIVKVGKDFSYTFNVNGTVKDRFVFYWSATPNSITEKEIAREEVNNVVVYKDQDTYKVRFDKAMKSADVFVYNISGQLVNTSRKVDTSNDYVLPIKGNASVYVVKIVGDNGTVVTKKIIK